ncbi:MAG TPA: endospore germination permease [Firmicutes bacterium]|nr:endospore germination permease [Candidatus Fermentithermobacillaceae bacterium]
MSEGLISARQLLLIAAIVRMGSMLIILPVVHYGGAPRDSWIAAIISTVASCLVAWLSAGVAMAFPKKSLGHIANAVLGRIAGTVATFTVALSQYVLCLARIRTMSLVIITQFMQRTPGWALALPVLLIALYGAVCGPDTMGRAAEIIFTALAIIVVGGCILVYASRAAPVAGLKPILANGLKPVLVASISPTFLGAVTGSIALSFGRFTKEPTRVGKSIMVSLMFTGVILVVVTIIVLTTLGPKQAEESITPLLSVAGSVHVSTVIERADLLLLAAWILGVTFDVTVLLLSASILIGDSLNLSYKSVAVALFVIGVIPVSHRITDVFMIGPFQSPEVTGPWTLVVFVGVIGLVYVATLIKKKGGHGR